MNRHIGKIFISDFSLHSIGVILFRLKKEKLFKEFILDVLPKVELVSLNQNLYIDLINIKKDFHLDFDDAYQYNIAFSNNFIIITLDKDFKKVDDRMQVEFL